MNQTVCDLPVTTIGLQFEPPIELYITETAFRPNPTTVRFARTVKVNPGDMVFDIGTGIGPLAIKAAMDGAVHVYAVDPVPLHCELARLNVAKYNFQDRVTVHQGGFFEPLDADPKLRNLKADVIIADVSGIADPVARALGWYSKGVPTGGQDGTNVIIDVLSKARSWLRPSGAIYFPIAIDLSDSDKIGTAANELFECVENAMERPTTNFPMTEQEVQAIHAAYADKLPSFIKIQEGRRPFWRGQIWKAARPR
jgi:methylase of polypeptide subunit release factors